MENTKRLQSYYFKCPCCKSTQKRLFEYYAKFHGYIDEKERLEDFREPSFLERVVIDGSDERKTVKIEGEPTYRCGICYEFFKFDDNESSPRTLAEPEKLDAYSRFKPIKLLPDTAIMNSVAYFDKLLNENGCSINQNGEIVIRANNGAEYTFDISVALVNAFYNNPNMGVNDNYKWKDNKPIVTRPIEMQDAMLKDA